MTQDEADLTVAIDAWRATRDPRFARVAEWASARLESRAPRAVVGAGGKASDAQAFREVEARHDPLDLPWLFAAFVAAVRSPEAQARIELLAQRDDPRFVSAALKLLAAPPYRAKTALGFFRTCVKALVDSGDPRAKAALEDLGRRFKSIIETSVGEDLALLCARSAQHMPSRLTPLDATQEALAEGLEARFRLELAEQSMVRGEARARGAREEELLAAVFAAPDDDSPRLVYADALLERGELRGELIQLQIARAAGQLTLPQLHREQELLSDPKRCSAWGLPLSLGGEVTFVRGFVERLRMSAKLHKELVGSPAWQTVREISLNQPSLRGAAQLFDAPVMRGVQAVFGLSRALVRGLAGAAARWETAGLVYVGEPVDAEDLAPLAALRRLRAYGAGPIDPRGPLAHPLLEALSLRFCAPQPRAVLEACPSLVAFACSSSHPDPIRAGDLHVLPRLRRLELGALPEPGTLAGLPVDDLTVHALPIGREGRAAAMREVVTRLLADLPALRALTLGRGEHTDTLPAVLDALRGSRLGRVQIGPCEIVLPGADAITVSAPPEALVRLDDLAAHPRVARLRIVPRVLDPLRLPEPIPPLESLHPRAASAWGARLVLDPDPEEQLASALAPRDPLG